MTDILRRASLMVQTEPGDARRVSKVTGIRVTDGRRILCSSEQSPQTACDSGACSCSKLSKQSSAGDRA